MPNPNEPVAAEKSPGTEPPHAGTPGVNLDAQEQRNERSRGPQPWGLAFALFALGFVALVVMSKLKLSPIAAGLVKGVAAGLCVAAFVIARRARKVPR